MIVNPQSLRVRSKDTCKEWIESKQCEGQIHFESFVGTLQDPEQGDLYQIQARCQTCGKVYVYTRKIEHRSEE